MNSLSSTQFQNQNLDLSSLANNFADSKELELAFTQLNNQENFTPKHIDRCIQKIVAELHEALLLFNEMPSEDIDQELLKVLQNACLQRKKFSLCGQSFCLTELQASFEYFKNATYLSFKSCLFTSKSFCVFPAFQTLETLKLDYSEGIKLDGVKRIASLQGVKTLSLKGVPIDDEGLKALSEMANLTSLNVGHTKITDNGLKAFRCQTLSTLNIACTQPRLYHELGLPFQQRAFRGVTTRGFISVIEQNNLKVIDVFGNFFISKEAINHAKAKNITVITTRHGKSISDIHMSLPIRARKKIAYFNASFSKWESDSLTLHFEELNSFLSTSDTSNFKFLKFASCGPSHNSTLEKQHLEGIAKKLPLLKILSFERYGKTFTGRYPLGISADAFWALKEFSNLEELNLSGHVFDTVSTQDFGLSLSCIKKLEVLNLADAAISDLTFIGISICVKLRHLNIQGCRDVSEEALFKFLREHKALRKLEISVGNNFSLQAVDRIKEINPELEVIVTKEQYLLERTVGRLLSLVSISVAKLKENPLFFDYLNNEARAVSFLDITPRTSDTNEPIKYRVTNENLRELAEQFPLVKRLKFAGAIFEAGCANEFLKFDKLGDLNLQDSCTILDQDELVLSFGMKAKGANYVKSVENMPKNMLENNVEQLSMFTIQIDDEKGNTTTFKP